MWKCECEKRKNLFSDTDIFVDEVNLIELVNISLFSLKVLNINSPFFENATFTKSIPTLYKEYVITYVFCMSINFAMCKI